MPTVRLRRAVIALAASASIACAARTLPIEGTADTGDLRPAEATWVDGAAGNPSAGESRKGSAAPVALRAVPSRTTLQTAEQWDAALASALTRLGNAPSAVDLVTVAAAYRRIGVGDKAIDYYAKALEADPKSAAAYDGLARVWRDWGYPGIGLAEAHRAVYYAPASPEAQNTLGTLLQALGAYSAARERYERALALDPGAAYALANMCGLELMEGKPENAVALCGRALTLDASLEIARRHLTRAEDMLARARSGGSDARR